MHIVILKGHSQYEGTRTFADEAARAFTRKGHTVHVEDLTTGDSIEQKIVDLGAAGGVDLVFTINVMGEFRDRQGRTIRDIFAAPHVIWHTDYILSQRERLEGTPSSTALMFVDPTQVDMVRSLYGAERFPHLHFFPHPAVGDQSPLDEDTAAFEAARPIPLLWSGSFQRPGKPAWDGAPAETQKVFRDAVALALSVEWMPPSEALDTVLIGRGMDLKDPANRGARAAATFVDIEVRQTRRFEFLKAVSRTKIPLTICGANWESQLYRFKTATYKGPVPMTRMSELMRQSRIVLNTNGNFGGGSHERPFSTLLAGAAPFSDISRYYQAEFVDGEDIVLFSWQDLAAGMDKLIALSRDADLCRTIAANGRKKVMEKHTWDARTDLVLEAARQIA